MNNEQLRDKLMCWDACQQSLDWLGTRDLDQMWNECDRADWLVWWLGRCAERDVDMARELVVGLRECMDLYLIQHCKIINMQHHKVLCSADTGLYRWTNKQGSHTPKTLHGLGIRLRMAANSYDIQSFEYSYIRACCCLASVPEIPLAMSVQTMVNIIVAMTKAPSAPLPREAANKVLCGTIRKRWPKCPLPA